MKLQKGIGVTRTLLRQIVTGGKSRYLPRYSGGDNDLFFREGWGDNALLQAMTERDWLPEHQLTTTPQLVRRSSKLCDRSHDGTFVSPLAEYLPGNAKQAHFRIHLPDNGEEFPPLAVICPMTGDEGFGHRTRNYTRRLLKKGIGTVLLEAPFYGSRRVDCEPTVFISNVAHMVLMGNSLIEEARLAINKLSALGFQRLVIAGVSQGGLVAAAAGALTPFPVGIAASLVAHSPHIIFSRGLLRAFTDWNAIQKSHSVLATTRRLRKVFEKGDITQLAPPVLPKAALLEGARFDAVVPIQSVSKVASRWQGAELRILPGTHISSLMFHSRSFVALIQDSLARLGEAAQ